VEGSLRTFYVLPEAPVGSIGTVVFVPLLRLNLTINQYCIKEKGILLHNTFFMYFCYPFGMQYPRANPSQQAFAFYSNNGMWDTFDSNDAQVH
jgi:hypothetical protein